MTYIFENVCVIGIRFSRTKSFKAKRKKVKREEKSNGTNREKETSKEFGARHRIFGVWPRSRGSALGDCLMHHAGGTLLQ